MALEDQVAALVTSTNALTSAVNVQKATLDTAVTTATNQASTATTQATAASASATTATTQASTATNQAASAGTHATNAATSAASAATAAAASGSVVFYASNAAAAAALSGLAANQIIRVFVDETKGYVSTWYQKVSGVMTFMMADVQLGTGPSQAPANHMLGTCAYLNQTWLHAEQSNVSFGALANNAETQVTFAMPGAKLGDFVMASTSIDSQGLLLDARVKDVDVVRVHYRNMTGASVTLANHTLYVRLMAKTPE